MDFRSFAISQAIRLLERLAFHINDAAHSHSPGAVHDLRVAVRRLTQALAVGKSSFPPREVKKIRRRVKTMMTLAGEVRDCDIALKLVAPSKAEGAAAVEAKLRSRRATGQKALVASLRDWTSRKSVSKWRHALQTVAIAADSKPSTVEDMARRKLPRLAQRFFREGRRVARQGSPAEEMHRFRLTAKKFRYTLELFAGLYGAAGADWLEQVKTVQTLLGDIHDAWVARGLVEDMGASAEMVAAFKRRQRRKMREFRQTWEEGMAGAAKQWVRAFQHVPRKPMARAAAPGQREMARHA